MELMLNHLSSKINTMTVLDRDDKTMCLDSAVCLFMVFCNGLKSSKFTLHQKICCFCEFLLLLLLLLLLMCRVKMK